MDEFAEKIKHLRLIHFSLLVVCLVLFISEDIDEEAKAIQAHFQIKSIRQLQTKWNGENLIDYLKEKWNLGDPNEPHFLELKLNLSDEKRKEIADDLLTSMPFATTIDERNRLFTNNELKFITDKLEIPKWTLRQKNNSLLPNKIRNLEDFKNLWNDFLVNPQYLYFLEVDPRNPEISWSLKYPRPGKFKYFLPNSLPLSHWEPYFYEGKKNVLGCEKVEGTFGTISEFSWLVLHWPEEKKQWDKWENDTGVFSRLSDTELHGMVQCLTFGAATATVKLIYKEKGRRELHLLNYLMPKTSQYNEGTSFEEAFPELQELTEHIQATPIGELEKHFKNIAETVGKKVEVLGVKLPLQILNKWGPLVLVLIQLYFLLHLVHFLQSAKEVLDIKRIQNFTMPWIGLYKGVFPRLAFFSTAAALPVFVIGNLSSEIIFPLDFQKFFFFWDQNKVKLSIVFAISSTLSILTFLKALQIFPKGSSETKNQAGNGEPPPPETSPPESSKTVSPKGKLGETEIENRDSSVGKPVPGESPGG